MTTDTVAAPWLRVLLGFLIAVGALATDLYLPALHSIEQDLAIEPGRIQYSFTGFLIGFAVGNALHGPLSDVYGRRRVLLIGFALFACGALLATVAPTFEILVAARILQGLGAAAGEVVVMAIVSDLWRGPGAARVYALLGQIMAISPVFGPFIGVALLTQFDWRGTFAALMIAALIGLGSIFVWLPETHPPERRGTQSVRAALLGYVSLRNNHAFLCYAIAIACCSASTFAYLSESAFIYVSHFGLTPQTYAIIFGLNAIGMILGAEINKAALRRYQLISVTYGGVAAHAAVTVGLVGLAGFLPHALWLHGGGLLLVFVCYGFIFGNILAIAIGTEPKRRGLASGGIGFLQNLMAAGSTAILGIVHNGTIFPAYSVMAIAALLALLALQCGRQLGRQGEWERR